MNLTRLLIFSCLFPASVLAAELFGTIEDLHGKGYVTDAAGNTVSLFIGQKIYEGQTLGSAVESEIHLVTVDGNFIGIRPNTQLRVDAYKAQHSADDKIHLSLLKGALRSITGWVAKLRNDAYQIRTPTSTIGVRGTDHETIELETSSGGIPAGTYERVLEGATVVRSKRGELEVRAGELGFASREKPDVPKLLADTPSFIKDRVLKLEPRIAQRKNNISRSQEAPREERENREASHEERSEGIREKTELTPEQREQIRDTYRDATPEQRERMERRVIRKLRHRD